MRCENGKNEAKRERKLVNVTFFPRLKTGD